VLAVLRGDRGAALPEFVLVAALLTVVTLSVLQLGLALHVRNTVVDAAAEGARYAALAGATLDDGRERTRALITAALGPGYASTVSAEYTQHLDRPATVVTVTAPLPLLGLIGLDEGLEVRGHAAVEDVE
jgi:Flp pilus assembly protein TadG